MDLKELHMKYEDYLDKEVVLECIQKKEEN